MLMKVKFIVAVLVVAIIGLSPLAVEAGNLITNGDFENTTDWGDVGTTDCPEGWVGYGLKNAAEIQSGTNAIGGSGTSAYMPAYYTKDASLRRQIGQTFAEPTDAEWSFSFDVAVEYAGSADDRSLQLILYPETGSRMMFRVAGGSSAGDLGALEFYRGSQGSWTPLVGLESCISYSTDVQTDALVHSITFTGHFDEASPVYDVSVTTPSGTTYSATGIDWFESGSAPSQGSGMKYFQFSTFNSNGDYLLDNVVVPDGIEVPEPSAVALLLTLVTALGLVYRKKMS